MATETPSSSPNDKTPASPPEIKDPQAVLNALSALKDEVKALKQERSQWAKTPDLDAERVQQLLTLERQVNEQKAKQEEDALVKQGEWEKLTDLKIQALNSEWEKKYNELTQEKQKTEGVKTETEQKLQSITSQYRQEQTKNQALAAFLAAGGRSEMFEYFWGGKLQRELSLGEDNTIYVPDGEGRLTDEEGKEVSVVDYLKKFKDTPEGGEFFKSSFSKSGTGSNGNFSVSSPGAKGSRLSIKKSEMSNTKAMNQLDIVVKQQFGGKYTALQAIQAGLVKIE